MILVDNIGPSAAKTILLEINLQGGGKSIDKRHITFNSYSLTMENAGLVT